MCQKLFATVVIVVSATLAHAGITQSVDFTGMWKGDCQDKFGMQIKPAGNDLYSVSFCGPGGCFKPGTYRPNTKIIGDPMYEQVSESKLKIKQTDGTVALFGKCSADPAPKNPKILN